MNEGKVFVFIMVAVFLISIFSIIGFGFYKIEIKKQAYYDCLEYNKQIAEKLKNNSYISLNSCDMF